MAVSPETMLISSVLRNGDLKAALQVHITPKMFQAYPDEWEWIIDYANLHKKTPSKAAFRFQFPGFAIKIADDTEHFARCVKQNHARLQLTSSVRDCTDLIASGNIDGAVAMMALRVNEIATAMHYTTDLDVIADWETTYKEVQARKERTEMYGQAGISTGFTVLDNVTGGIQPGQLWVLAARLGHKKSWSAVRIAVAALIAGHKVHYTSLEQPSIEVSMRVHNFLSGEIGKQIFQTQDLILGRETNLANYRKFLRGLKKNISGQMTVNDRRGVGFAELRAQVERTSPDLWIIDYLTLATKGQDWQGIGDFTKNVRQLAGDMGTGTLAAAQLNREAAGGATGSMGGVENLAGSDQIGQDADVIVLTQEMSPSVNKFRLAKHRNGKAGHTWYCHFNPSAGKFAEIPETLAFDLIDADALAAKKEAQANASK